ncbi:MAG: hypothetical protein A2622_02540 [Bdellovibrionales bacterium RIFCSPHIGHO2_01_FULL_40_29]|nr:MAG: hypothetical protein A2622_02540 [Bdellovibrionales bacterium RIFCSPHIGHO2_01_FULL_40_29]OFZ33959.1 MAG: hypothetical protein A3D17_02960 [Bdellovibrionales bacterium RIFCSPHIGHO2_02_FULL_40_15]
MNQLKFLLLFIFALSFSQITWAQRGQSSKRFTAGAMILVGQGQMGNGTDVPDRAMMHTPVALFAGFNMKKFRLGINYEYNLAGQTADPASVSNQNLSGKGAAMGVRAEFYDGKQSFGLIYRLSNTYTLDKPTLAGVSSTYKAAGGFSVQYYRQIKKRFGFVVDYTTEAFTESVPAPSENIKWSRISLGIVFTNFAALK